MSDIYALYHGLPWNLYRHLWWSRHPETGTFYGGSNLTEVQRMVVESALARGDEATAEMYLRDWGQGPKPMPVCHIFKFVPGAHFYACDAKFDTYEAAKKHATNQGYKVLGLKEVFVYTKKAIDSTPRTVRGAHSPLGGGGG